MRCTSDQQRTCRWACGDDDVCMRREASWQAGLSEEWRVADRIEREPADWLLAITCWAMVAAVVGFCSLAFFI